MNYYFLIFCIREVLTSGVFLTLERQPPRVSQFLEIVKT